MAKKTVATYTVRPNRSVDVGVPGQDGRVVVTTYGPGEDVELEQARGDALIKSGFLVISGGEESAGIKDVVDQIPANFPGAAALAEAGYVSFKALAKLGAEDLTAIEGIGEATAGKILEALAARKEK